MTVEEWLIRVATVFVAVLGAVLLAWSVRLVGAGVRLLPMSRTTEARVSAWLPLGGALAMLLYIGFVLQWLLQDEQARWLVPLVLLGIVVGSAWGALRDVADGLLLRSGGAFRVGDRVEVELTRSRVEGRIAEIGWRLLMVETSDGTVALVPYSKLTRSVVHRSTRVEHAHLHTFRIELPDVVPVPELKRAIRRALLLSPWCLHRRDPEVRAIGNELEVVVGLVDADHAVEAEEITRHAVATRARRATAAPPGA